MERTLLGLANAKYAEVEAKKDDYKQAMSSKPDADGTVHLLDGTAISLNTAKTQYQQRNKEYRYLKCIKELLNHVGDESKLECRDVLKDLLEPTNGGRKTSIEVHKGDSILALMQKYDGVKDLYAKLQKACESSGLTLNMATGVVD